MKYFIFTSFLVIASCVSSAPAAKAGTLQKTTIDSTRTCVAEHPVQCEDQVRAFLKGSVTEQVREELLFLLMQVLSAKNESEKVLAIKGHISEKSPYFKQAALIGAAESVKLGKFEEALASTLSIYLTLTQEEKLNASRIVFSGYLGSGQLEKAARWWSKLSDRKRQHADAVIKGFAAKEPVRFKELENLIKKFETEGTEREIEPAAAEPVPQQTQQQPITNETQQPAPTAEALTINLSRTPDWNSVCVFLTDDDKWSKVNSAIEAFYDWYLKEFSKSGTTPVYIRWSSFEDIAPAFEKALKANCFAAIGPLYSEQYGDEFERLAALNSLPVIGFTPYIPQGNSILFNVKYTKDREAADVAAALLQKGKQRFALAYPDDARGRQIRDIYWDAVEKAGGTVTEVIAFAPSEKAFLDDVSKLLRKPASYWSTLQRFKEENAGKYNTPTMMKRALGRFEKIAPTHADFDTIIMLGNNFQNAMIVPAFTYNNMEFDYYSGSEKRRIQENEDKLRTENLDWSIHQILAVVPSEARGDEAFAKNVDKLIDGMYAASTAQDTSEKNKSLVELKNRFAETFNRDLFSIEQTLAETAGIMLQAREASKKAGLVQFVEALSGGSFISLTANRKVSFNAKRQLTGQQELYIGVKNRGFVSASELFPAPVKESEDSKK